VYIRVTPQQSFNNDTVKLLICTKAAFGVSQKFVAYKPSYDDLIAQSTYTTSTSNTSIANLLYTAANAVGVSPSVIHFFMVSIYSDASDCLVICGAYKHGVVGYGVSMANGNITFEGAVNNFGTVGWTGGTAPYHVQVRFF
jgi:hypothetical protein